MSLHFDWIITSLLFHCETSKMDAVIPEIWKHLGALLVLTEQELTTLLEQQKLESQRALANQQDTTQWFQILSTYTKKAQHIGGSMRRF